MEVALVQVLYVQDFATYFKKTYVIVVPNAKGPHHKPETWASCFFPANLQEAVSRMLQIFSQTHSVTC